MSLRVEFTCRFCKTKYPVTPSTPTTTLTQPPCPNCRRDPQGVCRSSPLLPPLAGSTSGHELLKCRRKAKVSRETAARISGVSYRGLKQLEEGEAKASDGLAKVLKYIYATGNTVRSTFVLRGDGQYELSLDTISDAWLEVTHAGNLKAGETAQDLHARLEQEALAHLIEELRTLRAKHCRALPLMSSNLGAVIRVLTITLLEPHPS